jgi:Ca-activated chloride channel family protein
MVVSFDYPWALGGFVVFIPLLLFAVFSRREKRIRAVLPRTLLPRLRASSVCFNLFLACCLIALAGPRWGWEQAAGEYRRGLDAVIAVDVSRSMELRDAPPFGKSAGGAASGISRLERGIAVTGEAIAAVPGARFAAAISRNRGLLAVPLTWDNGATLQFLEALDGAALTGRGTNLETLVNAAAGAFQPSFPSRRVIVLVSDGEALSGSLKTALENCGRGDIGVIALALGSDEGTPVAGAEDVISRRDSAAMRMAAEQTGGLYIDGNRDDAASLLAARLRSLAGESEIRGGKRERKARWPLFIILAIMVYGASKLVLAGGRRE